MANLVPHGEDHLRPAIEAGIESLRAIGRQFHDFRWSLGTSSNYSVVLQRDPYAVAANGFWQR